MKALLFLLSLTSLFAPLSAHASAPGAGICFVTFVGEDFGSEPNMSTGDLAFDVSITNGFGHEHFVSEFPLYSQNIRYGDCAGARAKATRLAQSLHKAGQCSVVVDRSESCAAMIKREGL